MLIWENILLAFHGLRANKMRSLLTMLGIIIGIASVIAIMTLGDSISSSVTDSMASMGANNLTMGVRQKSSTTETTDSGMTFSFGPRMAQPTKDDYITEEMLEDLASHYPDEIKGFSLSENVGSGTARQGSLYAYVSVTGVNDVHLQNAELTLLAGRLLTERDQRESRKVALASDLLVEQMFGGDSGNAVGKTLFRSRHGLFQQFGRGYGDDALSAASDCRGPDAQHVGLQPAYHSDRLRCERNRFRRRGGGLHESPLVRQQ